MSRGQRWFPELRISALTPPGSYFDPPDVADAEGMVHVYAVPDPFLPSSSVMRTVLAPLRRASFASSRLTVVDDVSLNVSVGLMDTFTSSIFWQDATAEASFVTATGLKPFDDAQPAIPAASETAEIPNINFFTSNLL